MPLLKYAQWQNPPGVETTFVEGDTKLLQLRSRRVYSPDHSLYLGVYKTHLIGDCNESSKIFPLVVALREIDGQDRFLDFYSFDNNGILLSHGFSRVKAGQRIVNEQHDLSLERLIEKGPEISEMIGEYPLPAPLAVHTTVIDLRNNCLR